ncbi:hypothetical protein [Erwinia sp. B116]|uniref:hypothetical protein n=1 Tax=Erwinia sp. B116 TaxID=1561024 RepID=UPI000C758E75|nr:hypothetical protein [Erwinia sp. B116]PLV62317.1 hypothetical protein NV64_05620 [Erwinia sp. B116]
MSIRQLTLTESAQVSGAAFNLCEFDRGMAGFERFAKMFTNAYGGKDWRYIAAVNPEINRGMTGFLNNMGFDGKASLAGCRQQFA